MTTVDEACADLAGVREAVRHAFCGLATGEAKALPKANLDLGVGHFFQAMVAADSRTDLAAVKWVAVAPVGGTTAIRSHIMLSRRSTGELFATMEADPITAARTAAMSAIAAQHLARPDSTSIAFIGCGTQARSHLVALADVLPRLSCVTAHSRRRETADAFAAEARRAGFKAEVTDDPRAAIEVPMSSSAASRSAGSVSPLSTLYGWRRARSSPLSILPGRGILRASATSISWRPTTGTKAGSSPKRDGCSSPAHSTRI